MKVTAGVSALVFGMLLPLTSAQSTEYLEWIPLSDAIVLPESDDGTTGPIPIAIPGFPFWDSVQTQLYIGTNGLISFEIGYNSFINQDFPGSFSINNRYLVAPFWDDIDIRGGNGEISYQIFQAGEEIDTVNRFLQSQTNYTSFEGTWMIVVFWDSVHRYFGSSNSEENTFQAVLITDGVDSFSVFTYNCGLIEWDNGGTNTVGFNAAGQTYANAVPSGVDLACINGNASNWSNVIYTLSMMTDIPMEPAQQFTLDFINIDTPDGILESCNDCSSPKINFPYDFPFGEYNHSQAYVNDNGVISMRNTFPNDEDPSLFPTTSADIYWLYSVAPFWSDADLRNEGTVMWKFYTRSDIDFSPVDDVVSSDQNTTYVGSWMLVVHWDGVHPFPHGDDQAARYNQKRNSFQAVLTTDGTKSYAVFTYKCSSMEWANQPVIGTNAGGTTYNNHYLNGENYAFNIGCVHTGLANDTNNVVYDLVPNPDSVMSSLADPPYHPSIGSCAAANYTSCCTSDSCLGEPQLCYCDASCFLFGRCCYDAIEICPLDLLANDYLIVAERESLDHIAFNGTIFERIRTFVNGDAVGIDYHFSNNDVFWSDVSSDTIKRASLDGTGAQYTLVDSYISAVDDIAVDWVANNLYWIDAIWARIEVANLDGEFRAEIVRVGANTNPRGIAVDPERRLMFWTDWGSNPQIERADMDGSNRTAIINDGLLQPFGITVDYDGLKIYWCDYGNNIIQYADLNGDGRTTLAQDINGLVGIFSLTISGSDIFWTDKETNAVYATHKINGNDILGPNTTTVYSNFRFSIGGIEAVSSNRQGDAANPCDGSECTELCLLSNNPQGRTCVSADDTPPATPEPGSCADAEYGECCTHGQCAGRPATCFCDSNCYDRGDCCMDINVTCFEVPPRIPLDVAVVHLTATTATISWTIPEILNGEEEYYVRFGLQSDILDQRSESLFSGSDTTITDTIYSITLQNLHPDYTYYFVVTSQNQVSPKSTSIFMFTTAEAAPSGSPLNFMLTVTDNTVLTVSWDPPAEDMQNGDIIGYTINCMSNDVAIFDATVNIPQNISFGVFSNREVSCDIYASTAIGGGPMVTSNVTVLAPIGAQAYLPFIPLDILSSQDIVQFPEVDDSTSASIDLAPGGLPFGTSTQTTGYVGSNGLLSFETGYNFFFNLPFSVNDFRYLVAPFWDDVDTRSDSGDIFYQTIDSGPFLEQVNDYINYVRPTDFRATWMIVAYWVAVNPYPGFSSTAENTFQAIVATDSITTYSVFTYKCGLMEWGTGGTVGFTAAGNPFYNNDPSSNEIACVNTPDSDWSNVVYVLSENNPEIPPPSDVQFTDITNSSATVTWTVPFVSVQQNYTVLYGDAEDNINITAGTLQGNPDTNLTNLAYFLEISGLEQATTYYVQVSSTFDIYTLYSATAQFTTRERSPYGAPMNITGVADSLGITFTWAPPPGELLIDSYTLICTYGGGSTPIQVKLNPVQTFTLAELDPSTTYTCTISASTSGGPGPNSLPIQTATTDFTVTDDIYFPFIQLGAVYGVTQVFAEESDDGTTGPISIDPTFPFGFSEQTQFYVGTNGLLSFDTSYNSFSNQQFPGSVSSRYLVAPFWDDVDIRGGNGRISYEIHQNGYYLDEVNQFLQRKRPSDFVGTWMAVVYYDAIHPYFGATSPEENTFQALLVTDGTYSYAIFTYVCGLMEWDNGATIGFNAAEDPYNNYNPSSSEVACLSLPESNATNVVYRLSDSSPELEVPEGILVSDITRNMATVSFVIPRILKPETYRIQYGTDLNRLDSVSDTLSSTTDISEVNVTYTIPLDGLVTSTVYYVRVAATYDVVFTRYSELSVFRTLENEQGYYLGFIPLGDAGINFTACDDCTSDEIILPDGLPIGGYFHQTAYVGTNGLITFGRSFGGSTPEVFPSTNADVFWRYIVAPFWADFDSISNGAVSYAIYTNENSSSLLNDVSQLIQSETNDGDFVGSWMLVGYWENLPSPDEMNTFQGIVITNGSKSYAVYTYRCGNMSWSEEATIGFNAPPSLYEVHPKTDTELNPDTIACVHEDSPWNNVIYDLEPSPIILPVTPAPSSFTGSCRAAGYDTCCSTFFCSGSPADCFCDTFCRFLNDCCYDFEEICPDGTGDDAYDLLVANGEYIYTVHFEGNDNDVIRNEAGEKNIGVDVHFGNSQIFWSDVANDLIYRANMDGSDAEVIVSEGILVVDDIAVDWVSNKLFWVDAVWARVEAMDLGTLIRVEILRMGPNTNPRAIAVEPINRYIFWTDYGKAAKIERSFMDGGERRAIVSTNLKQPNGITIDYLTNQIYWTDSVLNKIEYANYDGTGRTELETSEAGLFSPFAVTVADNILFWTDSASGSIYATHKFNGTDPIGGDFGEIAHFPASIPYGIEALVSERQPSGNNACEMNNCSHVCLMNALGYSCACPYGYALENNGYECKEFGASGSGELFPEEGSCIDAGYNETCCEPANGYCGGYPATCFCDVFCYDRGDCCGDIDIICERMRPVVPTGAMAISVTGSTEIITWTVPYIEYTSELYTVFYSESRDSLASSTTPIPSYSDLLLENQTYTATLTGLDAVTTYYFLVQSENSELTTRTDVMEFTTTEAAPSGPPQNFAISVQVTSLVVSWELPTEDDSNGVIVSFTFVCRDNGSAVINMDLKPTALGIMVDLYKAGTTYMCTVAASTAEGMGPSSDAVSITTGSSLPSVITHPFIPTGVLLGSSTMDLPNGDEVISDAIEPPIRFPFGNSNGTSIYFSTNGLISFDTPYSSFFNAPFPGFVASRYIVAPYWDDADTSSGNGEIYSEIYDSGHYINQVNSYINTVRPSRFEGTWMVVITWDAIHSWPASSNTQDNTFQAILISDGTYTYVIFVYFCGLLEWGSPTIGYNAAGGSFSNFETSSVQVACLNQPLSDWSNVVYRLSTASAEIPLPEQVMVSAITMNSATVSWTIPSLTEQQMYYVEYGTDPDSLNLRTDTTASDSLLDGQMYSIPLNGLDDATTYYVRVVATFSDVYLYSTVESFTTIAAPPDGPPLNFTVSVAGVSLTFSWREPEGNHPILYYVLACTTDSGNALRFSLKPIVEITLEELMPSTTYTCTITAATSGGAGPLSERIAATTEARRSQDLYLPFFRGGITYGVEELVLPESDDGTEGPITIDPGFPLGSLVQPDFYVGTNGLLSFGTPYNSFFNQPFSEFGFISSYYLVAPYWDDVDTRGGNGVISYEIHDNGYYLDLVNTFMSQNRPSNFTGTWMALVTWDAVHPYFGATSPEENTFQAILVTDGVYTYTIFIYKCGLLEWDNGVTIGFSAASNPYANHDPSSSEVACLNIENSNFTNIVYRLSDANPEYPLPQDVTPSNVTLTTATVSWVIPSFLFQEDYIIEYGTDPRNLNMATDPIPSPSNTSLTNVMFSTTLSGLNDSTVYYLRVAAVYNEVFRRYSEQAYLRTKEPEQTIYLQFFEPTDTFVDSGVLDSCDDCTSPEIELPENTFPFGGYYHQSVYVDTNGLISFGRQVLSSTPEPFPSDVSDIFWSYIVAPFWSDVDTTINGSVYWEIHSTEQSASMLNKVSSFVQSQYSGIQFSGTWMLIATWKNVVSPTLTMGTFQAIIVTDGSQSYAVFTYRCGYLEWTSPATIGLNAPPDYFYNHPLTGSVVSPDEIACVHVTSEWNNVVFLMEENPVILPVTPEPSIFTGSCVAADYTDCCPSGCFATDCFCDDICFGFGDCCYDYTDICPDPASPPDYDLIVANGESIVLVHYEGESFENFRINESQTVQGIDIHFNRSSIFWSHADNFSSTINVIIDVNDTDVESVLIDTNLLVVADIAVDWIANNLYWVDAAWARIEVLSLDTMSRAEILRTGANTNPSAIAVDPVDRYMFWTDMGRTAMIERAFLDGSERHAIISTELSQPVGLTVDYVDRRIYWSDAERDIIEFSNFDGSGRMAVETEASGIYYPYALTIAGSVLFWSDLETNSVYATHKDHGSDPTLGHFSTIASFASTPYGIEAVLESRQQQADNPCETANCSHICLLTGGNEQGFTCACPDGYILESETLCRATDEPGATPPSIGTCALAGYTTCCTTGYCAGSPATCFCSPGCVALGSCCSDFASICIEAPPEMPVGLSADNINRTRADISWVVPSFTYGRETYVVQYGFNQDALTMTTDTIFSGLDTLLTYQLFSVTIKDLQPFTQYYYRVLATNILTTTTSDVATFTTLNIGPPTNFEIVAIGTESLRFRWDPPYDSDDLNIMSYTIYCNPQFHDEISVTVAFASTIALDSQFIPGTTYTCSVYATNAVGDGLAAEATATTLEGEGFLPFLILGDGKVCLPNEDDTTSESIEIIGGMATGDTTHTRVFVSTNGFISLDRSLLFWDASPFPTSEYYIMNSYMFAPFWSDVDTGASGSVSYEFYSRGNSDVEDAILDRVNGFLSNQTASGFNGYWMVVALWNKVHLFPHSLGPAGLTDDYAELLDKENTFQAILITNGTTTHAIYTYSCGLMEWSGYNTYATIGYNLNGEYENHFLSGSPVAHTIACSSGASKWNNLVYTVDMTGANEGQTQRSSCIIRAFDDADIFGEWDDVFFNLESCPCSLSQAQVDPRFGLYMSTDEYDCYVQLIPYGTLVQGCCYSTVDSNNGALLTTGYNRGTLFSNSPLFNSDEWQMYDSSLKSECCEAGLCNVYFERRPTDECTLYQPLSFAWGYGDPHFRNLDGATFTFNGQGEYFLVTVEETGFMLQGRTEPVVSGNNQGTRFTAFAFGIPSIDSVVEVRVERGRMIVFYNQDDVTTSLESSRLLKEGLALVLADENTFTALFSSGQVTHAVYVTLVPNVGYLTYALNLDNSQPLTTAGLLGIRNGNNSDDFTYPNGNSIPSDASDQMIHEWGQSWQITAEESLFFYGDGVSTSNYSNPAFTPSFKSDIVANAPNDTTTYCQSNPECIFDYSVSGDQAVASATLQANLAFIEKENKASMSPPTIYAVFEGFVITIGEPSTYDLWVDGGQLEVLGGLPENSDLNEDTNTSGLFHFTWTLSDTAVDPITFIATDSQGGVAVLSPPLLLCACENWGACTQNAFQPTQNNVLLLQCDCPEAWTGQFCTEDLNGCSQIHCFQGTQCSDVVAPQAGHMCSPCPSGFLQELEKCADIDECSRQDTNDCQQSCTNTFGSYECTCIVGYEPDPSDIATCIDVDECSTRTNDCEQICTNTDGSYTCSCMTGFTLNPDHTCTVQTECPETNECSDICTLVGGTQQCSCSRGYELINDTMCQDTNECLDSMVCEQVCNNTLGSFSCLCNAGYTINPDGRSCNDIDECVSGPICPEGQICQNTPGNFTCVCPEGTMLNADGDCETIPVVEPTKVVVPPSVSATTTSSQAPPPPMTSTVALVTPTPDARYFLIVTIPGLTVETFSADEFGKVAAEIISECCMDDNSDRCQVLKLKREVVDINVFIVNIKNGSDGDSVEFALIVTTSPDGTSLLKPESIEACLKSGEDKLRAAGFSSISYKYDVIETSESRGSGGLSGGAIAGIVIVVIFVVVAVGAVAAFILFRMKCRGKYTVSTLLSERMTQLGSSDEKKDLSALVMSMEEEGEL